MSTTCSRRTAVGRHRDLCNHKPNEALLLCRIYHRSRTIIQPLTKVQVRQRMTEASHAILSLNFWVGAVIQESLRQGLITNHESGQGLTSVVYYMLLVLIRTWATVAHNYLPARWYLIQNQASSEGLVKTLFWMRWFCQTCGTWRLVK